MKKFLLMILALVLLLCSCGDGGAGGGMTSPSDGSFEASKESETQFVESETETVTTTETDEPTPVVGECVVYPLDDSIQDIRRGIHHTVSVNDEANGVYRTEVTTFYDHEYFHSGDAEYTSFDFSGTATVKITADYDVENVEILPTRDGIEAVVSGREIVFSVQEPGQYFVKINGNVDNGITAENPLYIFANPIEKDAPKEGDSEVVYFGPGYHNVGTYTLKSNTTYYLAGGAYVCGQFIANSVKNVKICGRGILSGEYVAAVMNEGRAVYIKNSRDIVMDGVTVIHPWYWTIQFSNCSNVTVNNIKTISHGPSSDALDIVGSSHVTVDNCFFRAADDCVVIKAQPKECHDIQVRNCVIWCDTSNPMEIGYETHYDTYDVLFEEIDVINQGKAPTYRTEAIIGIEPHYGGDVYDITYRDIRVDLKMDATYSLFRISVDGGTGTIRDVTIEDIYVGYDSFLGGRIFGSENAAKVNGIILRNIVNGDECTLQEQDIKTNDHVETFVLEQQLPSKPCVTPPPMDVYNSLHHFFEEQGMYQFYYLYREHGAKEWKQLVYDGTYWCHWGECWSIIHIDGMSNDGGCDTAMAWKAPKSGTVTLTENVAKVYGSNRREPNRLAIYLNESLKPLWEDKIPINETVKQMESVTIEVQEGDMLYFVSASSARVLWNFQIEYVES